VGHLVGNRASFLRTKAPMLRIPKTNFLHGICTKAMMSASEHSCVWFGLHGRLTHGPTSYGHC
jgi:hypothetical protein